jgi:hypothetical protein
MQERTRRNSGEKELKEMKITLERILKRATVDKRVGGI